MAAIALSLPPQLLRRAATADFIVKLEVYFTLQVAEPQDKRFAQLPVPPDHLDRRAVEDCRAIAAMLSLARKNIYVVSWDAEQYATDAPHTVLPNPDEETRLMAKYRPLISGEEMARRHDDNLPLLLGPGIVSDIKGGVLFWYLPQVLSESRQAKILADTRILEAQLTVDDVDLGASPTKNWRTAHTFYSKGSEWTSGSTLLSPAAFTHGHSGAGFDPVPTVDVTSTRAHEWMRAFEESGGMLDGILAVTHPQLYAASQDLMAKMWRECGVIRPILSIWPSSFTCLQVFANRSTPGHRDIEGKPGWLDLLLTLGTYGNKAVLEFRGLGISLPYNAGTVVPIASKLLVHGVPAVRGDRVCYAFFMCGDLYTHFAIPIVGMATVPLPRHTEDHVKGPTVRAPAAKPGSISGGFMKDSGGSPMDAAPSGGAAVHVGGGSYDVHDDTAEMDGEDTEMAEE